MPISADVRELCRTALDRAKRHPDVTHAEVRYHRDRSERLRVRDGAPDGIGEHQSAGFAVRVIARGAWGFACTAIPAAKAMTQMVDDAVAIALASSRLIRAPVVLAPIEPQVGHYETPVAVDPFGVSLEQKLEDLSVPEAELRRGGPPIRSAEAWMSWTEIDKLLLTLEGTDVEQHLVYGDIGMLAVAVADDGRSQRRSFPGTPGTNGQQAGYEAIAEAGLTQAAPRIRREAIELLSAPQCPEGKRDVILASNQLALQVHESCGHPTELDRALGAEISLAGGSFLQPEQLGKLRYGSDIVTLTADSVAPRGLGTFGWDDEGTPAKKSPLIQDGIFVDYLSSRETAAALGRASTGTVRADGFNRVPMIRMINVSLEPRSGSLEDLILDTRDGILFDTNQSWSIDDLRLNFQFSCELAWEIKNGKRVRLLRDARYTGVTPELWRSCDAICGPEETRIWGLANCGKGDPIQAMQVAHGAPPARFRNTEVGHS
ncbi:MAG: TldD/PmbA family protein [Myxococcales bacterium]|nr:TldD/PmbA family protein [Myxococcales bacterium]MCB9581384.1 TldD/PmbA family protein [Polyangiaceae bacterium]